LTKKLVHHYIQLAATNKNVGSHLKVRQFDLHEQVFHCRKAKKRCMIEELHSPDLCFYFFAGFFLLPAFFFFAATNFSITLSYLTIAKTTKLLLHTYCVSTVSGKELTNYSGGVRASLLLPACIFIFAFVSVILCGI
jgi:hypothetical protein